jgi:hypothetical protein
LYYSCDSIWAVSRDEFPQPTKQKNDTEKWLVSILWSVIGIHSLLDLPKGTTYNMAFFTDAVLPCLIEDVRSQTYRKTLKGWLIRMDGARPGNSRRAQRCTDASRAKFLPHPVYSPDLAPNDFLLSGHIKGKLSDYSCESREDLLNAIAEIARELAKNWGEVFSNLGQTA